MFGETTLRVVSESFLNRTSTSSCPTCWLLDPVTSRTVSRPAVSGLDPADANLATTETFEYDASGFQKAAQIVDSERE